MSATPPLPLFDENLRDKRRARARALGFADFLHADALRQIDERRKEINRSFTSGAIVSGFPDFFAQSAPIALPGTDWHFVADAPMLDLPRAALDVVVHLMCLHCANDPVGQIVQSRLALKPDGMFIAAMLGGRSLHELRQSLVQAETEVRGGMAPRIAPMGDIRDLGALLQRAGLALPVADSDTLTVTYKSARHLMHDLRCMGETNILSAQDKRPLPRRVIDRTCEIYAEAFAAEGGRIKATFEIVYLTGWAPDESQQKPLQPGSATSRLADALETTERDPRLPPDFGKDMSD
jgi:SAM-dependent methyltransferase